MAAPAPALLSAVAATAPTAFVVHLVTSGSATEPAQSSALLLRLSVLLAAAAGRSCLQANSATAALVGASLSVAALANVLPGNFVQIVPTPRLGGVLERARESASHSRISGVKRARHRSSGPSSCPYSPECVE